MHSDQEIIAAISRIIQEPSIWKIGTADMPEYARKEHGNPNIWMEWCTASQLDAEAVQCHFLRQGVRVALDGTGKGNYVYLLLV